MYWINEHFVAITVVIIALIAGGVLLTFAIASDKEFKKNCESMNGHTHSSTQTSNTFGSHYVNGKSVTGSYTTTTTTTYCIANNGGGILDIQ